ncbi:uncharacterized protein LOC112201619 [Rosa chinensis]|uniref:uncharacterized protein LOC112201619 n=1 Tax=Rosa chinensis TaxID=74649 RepID=UPI000D08E88A|nr:uncharacterized protein LOC112201619 [Rosa chinensis]
MKVLAWNCRGINNLAAVQSLKRLIQQHRPSIIFISETKVDDWEYLNSLRLQLGFLNCEAVFTGRSGGVALLWADGLDILFRSKSSSHVDVEVRAFDGSGIAWRLTGLYGQPVTANRHLTWTLLQDLGAESSLLWVVIGDMNELLHASEKEGGVVRREGQMQPFRDVLNHCDLVDLRFHGAPYTWRGPNMRSRLDRAVATSSWSDIFPTARVSHLPPIHGDHVPILLAINSVVPQVWRKGFRRFRFESFWVQHQDCQNVISEGWVKQVMGQPMYQVSRRIMHTRISLSNWQRSVFGCRSREIDQLRTRLQVISESPLTEVNQSESVSLYSKLDGLLEEENTYWKQRSKVAWLVEGDRNTKFFPP